MTNETARLPYDLRVQIGRALDRFVCDDSTPEQVDKFIATFSDFGLRISADDDFGAPAPSQNVDVEGEIARIVQSVNEWDDRTSPDDYPEHLLITSEELSDILRNFAATLEGRTYG